MEDITFQSGKHIVTSSKVSGGVWDDGEWCWMALMGVMWPELKLVYKMTMCVTKMFMMPMLSWCASLDCRAMNMKELGIVEDVGLDFVQDCEY
ncbi:hypothetical protein Hanom_Chr12g01073561 [Helianthus anomalus]